MINIVKKIFLIFFFLNFSTAFSNDDIYFIDLDKLLKNSNSGKEILSKIEILNNQNIENLKKKNSELKQLENDIKIKQNIVSKKEFDKEMTELREKVKIYREIKDKMVFDFNKKKDDYIRTFFSQVNPIIQEYMEINSIDILLESKNVFIGKNNLDITDTIINEVNLKLE